jgi:hypothetical protein
MEETALLYAIRPDRGGMIITTLVDRRAKSSHGLGAVTTAKTLPDF